ncbi:hypothetical protein [Kocuria dechangensis]|uniref:hypothetical protein n=1 Tax=Kocuria dechangensis TaxID=1176249 RepID=UPI00166DACAF|nr:hypothetical protein [Kocuria dechangensis]
MGDDAVAREQARLLRQAIHRAGIARDQLWLHYFSLGGEAGEIEVDAYLHQSFALPPFQRDLLAHAANELIARIPRPRAPYVSDLVDGDNAAED